MEKKFRKECAMHGTEWMAEKIFNNKIRTYCITCQANALFLERKRDYESYKKATIERHLEEVEREKKNLTAKPEIGDYIMWGIMFLFSLVFFTGFVNLPLMLVGYLLGDFQNEDASIPDYVVWYEIIVIPLSYIIAISWLIKRRKKKIELLNSSTPNFLPEPTLGPITKELFEQGKIEERKVIEFKEHLASEYRLSSRKVNMQKIDDMDGYEFEEYTKILLLKLGYKDAEVTKRSGDSGVDLIAVNPKGERVSIQCKRYSPENKVGNSAIQEIYTGKALYKCSKAIVITTSTFTKQAMDMAKQLEIELWDRKVLQERISQTNTNKKTWDEFLNSYYV